VYGDGVVGAQFYDDVGVWVSVAEVLALRESLCRPVCRSGESGVVAFLVAMVENVRLAHCGTRT
jgi:hypothetical protein